MFPRITSRLPQVAALRPARATSYGISPFTAALTPSWLRRPFSTETPTELQLVHIADSAAKVSISPAVLAILHHTHSSVSVEECRINLINNLPTSPKQPQAFRITVDSGGCHGYQYVMGLTQEIDPVEDIVAYVFVLVFPARSVFEKDGAKVVVDKISLDLCHGSTLEYVEELIGSSFQVVGNPKAESSCGCKISFNVN
ncbi:[4Fe-4S] proteins maturation [Podochytrium sp. JEL0797]|nr:[4Fe-4S] proteins maturation [Podochytrium sp. JEL0797]